MSKRKKNKDKLPPHKSVLGYKIMGLTVLSVLAAVAINVCSHLLGNFLVERYDTIGGYQISIATASNLLSVAGYFWTFLALIRIVISDIHHLSTDVKRIAGGELHHQIQLQLNRKDELGDLARDISIMQDSLLERMEAERKAIQSNRELITALSHDLRTPLTKQMCAIELALKKGGESAETEKTLRQIYHHAEQIKEISDELFSYFLAEDSEHLPQFETFDGQMLFAQLLSEYADFLESSGFSVTVQLPDTQAFSIQTDSSFLARIMDNLASNIRKYADSKQPVCMTLQLSENSVHIHFINTVKTDDGKLMDSSNIGIRSAQQMAERVNGTLMTELCGDCFTATLSLPIEIKK